MHVYTGTGKGKSSAAFGLSLRAWGHGLRVCVLQFIKSTEYSGEFKAVSSMDGIDIEQFGTGRFFGKKGPSEEDMALAHQGLERAREALGGGYDLVILDELNVAIGMGLLELEEAMEVVKGRREGVEVVVTGRNAPQPLIDMADYVTEFVARKHPFDRGVHARKGVEF
jgi:cob(I)alamin adenosyltransferase